MNAWLMFGRVQKWLVRADSGGELETGVQERLNVHDRAPYNSHMVPGVCITAFFCFEDQVLFQLKINYLKYPPLIIKEYMVIEDHFQTLKEEHENAVISLLDVGDPRSIPGEMVCSEINFPWITT